VIVIPKEHEEAVLTQAEKIEAAEEKIRAALESGMRLDEAREINKYHSLQTKEQ
jgi:4-hydroxy-4-methyl-2-oxoglutarate aldolase